MALRLAAHRDATGGPNPSRRPTASAINPFVAAAGVVLSASAALGLARLFTDSGWVAPAAVAVAGAFSIVAFTRRRRPLIGLGALAAGLVLLALGAVAGHTTFYGSPTLATFEALGRAFTDGFEAFGEAKPPMHTTAGFVLLSTVGVWAVTAATAWLTMRSPVPMAGIVPPIVMFVTLAIFDPHGLDVPTTVAITTATLFFVCAHHAATLPEGWFEGRRPPPNRWRLVTAGAAVAVFAGAAGVVVGPNLPGADAHALIEVRKSTEEGEGPREVKSPLVDIKARLTTNPPRDLFTVESPTPLYWRLTALPTYEEQGWASYLDYDKLDRHLDGLPDGVARPPVRQRFDIGDLEFFWLPAAYKPVDLDLDDARVNGETLTLYTREDTASDLSYEVASEIPRWTVAELANAKVSPDRAMRGYLALPRSFPASIRDLAAKVTAGAKSPYQAARALLEHMRSEYRYDLTAPPGHRPAELATFLFERKAGYCEQFAASFAAMARTLGIPARVAVGWTPGVYNQSLKQYTVTTAESHAWVELHFAGFGWVTFEPTPGRQSPDPTQGGAAPDPESLLTAGPPEAPNDETTDDATGDASGIGAGAGGGGSRPPTPEDGGAGDQRGPASSSWWSWIVIVGLALILVALAVAAIPPLIKRWRRNRRRQATHPRTRIAGAWAEAIDRLKEVGAVAPAAATPLEFAGAFSQVAPVHQRDIVLGLSGLAGIFTHSSYAPDDPTDDEATRAWICVDVITAALDAADSFLGRTIRRLDPATLRGDRQAGGPAFST